MQSLEQAKLDQQHRLNMEQAEKVSQATNIFHIHVIGQTRTHQQHHLSQCNRTQPTTLHFKISRRYRKTLLLFPKRASPRSIPSRHILPRLRILHPQHPPSFSAHHSPGRRYSFIQIPSIFGTSAFFRPRIIHEQYEYCL